MGFIDCDFTVLAHSHRSHQPFLPAWQVFLKEKALINLIHANCMHQVAHRQSLRSASEHGGANSHIVTSGAGGDKKLELK